MKNVICFRNIALVAIAAALFTSCSKKTVDPAEAAKNLVASSEPFMLASLSVKSILDKGGISNYENVPMVVKPLMGDKLNMFIKPSATGLDFTEKSYILAYPGEPEPEMILIAKVADEEKATAYLAESFEADAQENDGYNYIIDETVQAWNDKILIIANVKGDKEAQLKRISEIFEMAVESKGTPKKAFTDAIESKKDIAICMSFTKAMQMDEESDEKLKELFKNCYMNINTAFDNGKISVEVKSDLTAKAKEHVDFFSNEGLPASYRSYMGINQPWAAMGVNMNFDNYYSKMMNFIPEAVRLQMKKELGMDITNDPQIKELIGGLGEHIMISISAGASTIASETAKEKNYSYKPTFIAVMELKGELLKTMIDSALIKFRKDGYYSFSDEKNADQVAFLIFTDNNAAVFTNSTAVLNEIKTNGKLPETKLALADPLFKYPMAGFADFQEARGDISQLDADASAMLREFESMAYYGTSTEMKFEMNFVNKDKNGLWILFNTAKKVSTDMMKKRLMPSF